ncbi:hypothetical protein [Lacrimispora sp.]|uniref:hypothetical protein n=1 Tax=Lacrimispora sp. TaxID=2719234 RepID=UPI0028AD81AC|nr:hypothetical protein [Lacrimispora sp.]
MSFAVEMLKKLTSAYNRSDVMKIEAGETPSTNIGKLFHLAGWGFDIIRDQTEKVRLWDNLDAMKGKHLDRYGADFGVIRGESSDEIFRIMIKVKIIAMLAAGNLDTVILSAASLFGVNAEDVKAEEVYPSKIYLYIDEDKLDEEHKSVADVIAGLMARIKSAGVGIRIFYRTYFSSNKNLYLATLTSQNVKLCARPDASNKYVTLDTPIKAAAATLEVIKVQFAATQQNMS